MAQQCITCILNQNMQPKLMCRKKGEEIAKEIARSCNVNISVFLKTIQRLPFLKFGAFYSGERGVYGEG